MRNLSAIYAEASGVAHDTASHEAGLRAVEAAVRADQIEKDAQVAERATRIAHDEAEVRGFEQATSLIAAVIRAQLTEGNTDE